MATGVPIYTNGHGGDIALSYPGKRGAAEIPKPGCGEIITLYPGAASRRLYFGENLAVLHALRHDPQVCGKVDLVYIDPPFATQTAFYSRKQQHAYTDNLNRPAFIEFLRERLILLHELLAETGSIYLHLDEKMLFELKIVMDEVFGPANYRNLIVRKKCNPKNYTRKTYGNVADFILFYTKSEQYTWNRPVEGLSPESQKEYQYVEPETGRRFMKVPIHAPGTRKGETGKPWRGMMPPPGKHWQYPPATLDEMDARGEIFWSKNGNPRRKIYLDEHLGVGVQDIWLEFRDAHNQNIKITGYPTEKNPDLLRRIIEASSNPGDLVLDCFAGSGTTLAVADELQRHWIGVDNSPEALRTMLERFDNGLQRMGDFVEKPPKAKAQSPQASLFDSLDDTPPPPPAANSSKLVEFSLLAVAEAQTDLAEIIEPWLSRRYPMPSEQPQPAAVREQDDFADICHFLREQDSKLANVIDLIGPCRLRAGHTGFGFLADAILTQQLSKKAADSIINKFRALFGNTLLNATRFLALARENVLAAGVSAHQYECLLDLAQKIHAGELELESLARVSDEEIRACLQQVRGIGEWTADMYLLFGLGRLDVFPARDLSLRKIIASVYGIDADDGERLEALAACWSPYRGIASWYWYKYGNRE